MIQVLPYNLPDYDVLNSEKVFDFFIWQPDKTYLILGQSNKPETALFADKVLKEKIPVYKRPSGGESVILTRNMLVISVAFSETVLKNPKGYFQKINTSIILSLSQLNLQNLGKKGISDICIGNKKILGSSIYRRPGRVFYHAVLNVSEEIEIISNYLRHPAKEPDYRQGRNHEEFVTSLKKEGYSLKISNIAEKISKNFAVLEKTISTF